MKKMKLSPRLLFVLRDFEHYLSLETNLLKSDTELANEYKNKWYQVYQNKDTDCGIVYSELTCQMIFDYLEENDKELYDKISEVYITLHTFNGLSIYVKFENL